MAWYGYCEYDGTEIINVERTEAYVHAMPWFKRTYDTDVLEQIFDTTYNNPATDNAPWVDPDTLDSYGFWGVYPLGVEGIENSTRESTVVQNIRDGGNPGRLRHGTRSVVFNTVLMGESECAVEYGFNWLKSALLGTPCRPNGTTRCHGSSLSYFSCEPFVSEGTDTCLTAASDTFQRTMSGPTLGTPDVGGVWQNYGAGAVWSIDANFRAFASAGPAADHAITVIETGLKDGVLEVTFPVVQAGNANGAVIRLIDASNYVVAGDSQLFYRLPAGLTAIGPVFSQTFIAGDRMRVEFNGSLIRVYRQVAATGDYTQVVEQTVPHHLSATKHGLFEFNAAVSTSRFDNFSVVSCVTPAQSTLAILDGGLEPDAPSQQQFIDEFDRADAAMLGDPWVYSAFGGATAGYSVIDETAKVTTASAVSGYSFATVPAQADAVIETVITHTSSDPFSGMAFRRDPLVASSGFVADLSDIYFGPSFSSLGSYTGPDFADGDTMRIYLSGSGIRVDKKLAGAGDWSTVGTFTSTDYQTNIHHGLAGWSDEAATARWDNFRMMYQTTPYVIVDGGTPSTVFTADFDGGAPNTAHPITLFEPLPAPFTLPDATENDDPTGCLSTMQRYLNEVQFNSGPEITKKKILTDGSCVWTVQFTAVAGDPFEYGRERVVVDGFLSGETVDPYGEDVDGPHDSIGFAYNDPGCPPMSWSGVYDPLCPALVAPPAPVDVIAGCFTVTTDWWRRYFTIPKEFVPLWGYSVPLIKVTAQFEDLRNVRLRLYANPNDAGINSIDECHPSGDLLLSYVPQDNTLVIDGINRQVYVEDQDGVQRRADSLVFTSEGLPLVWPELTCGDGYIVTVDTLEGTDFPEVDLSLVAKVT